MMLDEGLIKGFKYIKAWGGDEIIVLENNIRITPTGIHYLKDNSIMRKLVEKYQKLHPLPAYLYKKVKS